MDKKLLEIIAKRKTSEELFQLADISPVRCWDFSLPTLAKEKRFTGRKPWTDASLFREQFFKQYSILTDIDLDNLALVGGSVLSLLSGAFTSKDLDFFVITEDPNLSPEDAAEFAHNRVKKFITDLFETMVKENESLKAAERTAQLNNPDYKIPFNHFYKLDEFQVRRTLNVYTVDVPLIGLNSYSPTTFPIQLVTTPYVNLASLLQRVDVGCTAIAFYKNDIFFSELSKFAFTNSCFVVDGTSKAPDHILRIIKYFNRGYDIILPNLDTSKIMKRNFAFDEAEVIDLPYMTIVAKKIKGENKICITNLRKPKVEIVYENEHGIPSQPFDEYDQANNESFKMVAGAIRHNNIVCLINETYDGFIIDGEGSNYANAFRPRPYITDRMLIFAYDTVKANAYAKGKLDLNSLIKYFPLMDPAELFQNILIEWIETKRTHGLKRKQLFDKSYNTYIESVLDNLIAKQIEIAKEKIRLLDTIPLKPISIETRFSGNCTPDHFYGMYFKQLTP